MGETGAIPRRGFLRNLGAAFAAAAVENSYAGKLAALAQTPPNWNPSDWSKEFPGNWPQQEAGLLQIPLTRDQALLLLKNKVYKAVLEQDTVINGIKSRGIWPHKVWLNKEIDLPVLVIKEALREFDNNILDEYHQNNDWDAHKKEELNAGSVWRRFWRRLSNHYHEDNLKFEVKLRQQYPGGPSSYPSDIQQKIKQTLEIVGKETMDRNQAYYDAVLKTHNVEPDNKTPEGKKAYAMITHKAPQLDYPKITEALGIHSDFLVITRDDLKAIGINVDEALASLRAKTRTGAER